MALTADARQRLELWPERDLAAADLGFHAGFLRVARVELRVVSDGAVVAGNEAVLDVCDVHVREAVHPPGRPPRQAGHPGASRGRPR